MFERYTEKARRVIFFSRYEASQYGSPYIEPEHMLLGLMREDKLLFASLTPTQGSAKLQAEVRRGLEPSPGTANTNVDLPFSRLARLVLASAAEESERFGQKYIEPRHLLHGLLAVPSSAADALRHHDLDVEKLRNQPTDDSASSTPSPAEVLSQLRREFIPALLRLTPEIEPAVVFRLEPGKKESGS